MPEPIDSDRSWFVNNFILFARLLRSAGMDISPEQVSDLVGVLPAIGVESRLDLQCAARALLVRRRDDLATFDRAFELFFAQRGRPQKSVIDATAAPSHRVFRPKTIQQLTERRTHSETENSPDQESRPDEILTYSPLETLRRKDFSEFSEDEIRDARRLISDLDWDLGERRTRRKRPAPRGASIDFSRLVRSNLRYGAELFRLPAREPKWKPRPLVVLADISGSMERYSRMVLHLLHALEQNTPRAEVFLFGTRLTRVTLDLKRRSVDAALARVGQRVPDWSGGTRMGQVLKEFNFRWARRVVRSGAVVLILSDGWDCGDLALLGEEIGRLRRSCYRLIWSSPLINAEEALPQGLQVALPWVDDFLPVYNLTTLDALVAKLAAVQVARPARRQSPRVAIPAADEPDKFDPMETPQMGTSDYVRRTLTLRNVNGLTTLQYEENPSDS